MDGIIFDLDGTLWDSREAVSRAWTEVIERDFPQLVPPTAEEFGKQMGKLLSDIGASLYPELSKEDSQRLVDTCCEYECKYISEKGAKLFDGMEETLAQLSKQYKLYIVSNCQKGYIEAFYASHHLDKYFSGKLCCGDTGLLKADNIRLTVDREKLSSAIYVGDTALDGSSAREAGLPFVWAAYGFGTPESCDAKINSITELPDLCKRLGEANIN